MSKRIVIKVGGRVQSDGNLFWQLRNAWDHSAGDLCVVHGGGDEVTELQRRLGREPSFENGRRVTSVEDLEILRMVLSGSANKRLVSALVAVGIPAVGISGEDAATIEAQAMPEGQLGRAGKPSLIQVRLLETLLNAGYMPVISPLARDATSESGAAINVNGDDAAASLAAALGAELWLISDVPGVMSVDNAVMVSLDTAQADELIARGVVNGGMRAKLEAGFAALAAGVRGVRIASLNAVTDRSLGTALILTPGTT